MKTARYVSAKEAARELGITPATLYSYVSRGLVRSEEGAGTKRERKYHAEDVRKLKQRNQLRRDPAKATEGALHWGAPLMESAITLIDGGRLYYRGLDACELAATRKVEEVAALLWNGTPERPIDFSGRVRGARQRTPRPNIPALQTALAAAEDPAAFDLRPIGVARSGERIMRTMTAVAAGTDTVGDIATTLADAWASGRPHARRLLAAALVLAADHELNVSAFTVRCTASAGATPFQAVIAGLAAITGTKHGGHTERVEALFDEIGRPERAGEAAAARLRRGEGVPGFGHTLYPEGDPRGAMLTRLVAEAAPRSAAVRLGEAVRAAMLELTGDFPTIDFGLVMLARALGLPPGSPLALFALGRTMGWIGHAMEQYAADRIIRPRARYVGVLP